MNPFSPALFLLVLYGCSGLRVTPAQPNELWVNPALTCQIPETTVELVVDYRAPDLVNSEGLKRFCATMYQHFSQSNLSVEQATTLYQWIWQSGLNLHEPMGMPDPNEPIPPRANDFSERMMLKHVGGSEYEIYFVKIGCGKTYFHGRFVFTTPDTPFNLSPIEVWRAVVPC